LIQRKKPSVLRQSHQSQKTKILLGDGIKLVTEILEHAQKLVDRFKTRNPFEIADGLGVEVWQRPLVKLKGFYTYARKSRYIIINSELDEVLKPLVCAHELGHDQFHIQLARYTLWQDVMISNMSTRPEREANLFAAELLLSDEAVLEVLDEDITFFNAARMLYVPPELLDFKFQILKFKGIRLNAVLNASSNFLKR